MSKSLRLAVVVLMLSGLCRGQDDPEVTRTAKPAWVHVEEELPILGEVTDRTPDMEYLIYERQTDVEAEQTFTRLVVWVAREGGLQSAGEWSVTFDPTYQSVAVHRIRIMRNGETMDRLDTAEFRYLEKEEDADWHIYDGDVTAMTLLEDVRIGDVVEFAYTITGRNPVFDGTYFSGYSLGWGTPVRSMRVAVSADPARQIGRAAFGPEIDAPVESLEAGQVTWAWNQAEVPAIPYEDATPSWYSERPWVQLSEYSGWSEVVDWALPLYAAGDDAPGESLQAEIEDLPAAIGAEGEHHRMAQLLAYVQREIRYLGIELGESSHQPHDPIETYTRRFGDCKDKTLLLVQLLRHEGYEAYPVLVHSSDGERLNERLPSPGVFDHVIVGLVLDGEWLWLDPTMNPYRGSLHARSAPDYGFGLVIKSGETALRRIEQDPAARPVTKVVETINVGGFAEFSVMTVDSEYQGRAAPGVQSRLENTSPAQMGQDYQEFYANVYPQIVMTEDIDWEAVPDGSLTVTEKYKIEGIWVRDDDQGAWVLETYAGIVGGELPSGVGVERSAPRAVSHPVAVEQQQILHLPDEWDVSLADELIDNPWFRYSRTVRQVTGTRLEISFSYESKATHVAPENMSQYVNDLLAARDSLGLVLTQWDDVDEALLDQPFAPNILMFVVAFFSFGVSTGAVIWWVRRHHRQGPPPLTDLKTPSIGGWLILPCIGAVISPIRLLVQLFTEFSDAFDQNIWAAITTPGLESYDAGLALLVIFEVGANMFMMVLVIATLWFFLKRDRCLPRLYQFVLIFTLVVAIADLVALGALGLLIDEEIATGLGEIIRLIVGIAIWVPYFAVSKRVKRTFVR